MTNTIETRGYFNTFWGLLGIGKDETHWNYFTHKNTLRYDVAIEIAPSLIAL